MNKIVLYSNMFLILLNVQKDSLLYNWNWIGWTCTSYESILIFFFFLFVNIYHWFVISLGTEWFSVSSIFFNSDLNFDKVSTYRILIFKLFHIYIVEGIKESLAEDSLQKGKIISFPFLNGYTDVLCMVGWGGGSMYKDN